MSLNTKIAIFASGSGSNFSALEKACQSGELNAEIVLVVTDKPQAYVTKRAGEAGIPVAIVQPKEFDSKEAFESELLTRLSASGAEWLVLAGYMRLIGSVLLAAYPAKIVNIHPSLLPSFPGKDAVGQAVSHGVKVTGVTVHLVDEGMDTGPILAQQAVEVVMGDEEKTADAIHRIEHELYKKALQELFRR